MAPHLVIIAGLPSSPRLHRPLRTKGKKEDNHSDRILIKSPHLREALKRYGEGLTGQDEWAQLLVVAEKEAPFILPLLRNMAEEGHIIKPDEPYRALFKELAKATPACALCHLGPEMDSIIKCLMTEDNVTQMSSVMKALAEQCPLW
ncbi:hypothetical protein AALO_G00046610 [Alosa alosa]|uniref:Uncharacterized protein n=1 Tax=Alosa alosa TaxID=278164 RepID=A0AAV6H9G4_9TELE|nr:hypothetical protein AALO_G00046610 [Alosa alosa]